MKWATQGNSGKSYFEILLFWGKIPVACWQLIPVFLYSSFWASEHCQEKKKKDSKLQDQIIKISGSAHLSLCPGSSHKPWMPVSPHISNLISFLSPVPTPPTSSVDSPPVPSESMYVFIYLLSHSSFFLFSDV